FSREHVYSLGLAGDQVVWWEKSYGLCFQWAAHEASLGAAPVDLGRGYGCLGGVPTVGSGTPVGAGALLIRSAWKMVYGDAGRVVGEQAIERVEPSGCPCQAISSSPGPYEPLDVDAGRIVASGEHEAR